jgi:hypothetical protein
MPLLPAHVTDPLEEEDDYCMMNLYRIWQSILGLLEKVKFLD